MKKFITLTIALFIATTFAFAQSAVSALPEDDIQVDLSQKIIVPENQHLAPDDKSGKVTLIYYPMTDEARGIYTAMYNLYDSGNGYDAIIACFEDLRVQQQYNRINFVSKDKERYFKDSRGIKWAEYTVHIKYTR